VENTTGFSTTNPWAILDHPCIMRQGGASREECDEIEGIDGANRGETEDSDFRSSHNTSYASGENSIEHKRVKSSDNYDHSYEARQREGSSSTRITKKHYNTTQKKKFRKSVFNRPCCRNHESRESSNEQSSANPWVIFACPHTTGQGETHQMEINKEVEMEKCNKGETRRIKIQH
jgi:hypothetical protein